MQAIAAALLIENGVIPPTCNADEQDAQCPVNLVKNEPAQVESEIVLTNAIGFGGFYYAATAFGI